MNESLKAVYQSISASNRFPPNSRYYGATTATLKLPDGREAVYLRQRIIPQPESLSLLQQHTVVQGERLDTIAANYLGDPEQFWRLCDANRAMWPPALTENRGEVLRITWPEGIAGQSGA